MTSSNHEPASSLRVLIIDDESNMARSLKRVLHHAGYQTNVATDGESAIGLIERYQPHIVTLDLCMPWVSGYQVLETIKNSGHANKIKILVVSALQRWELENALEHGADAFLAKPFENEELLQTVRSLIDSDQEAP